MIRFTDALERARTKKNDEGFSLIELLVVVIIIGILAAIAIPVYIGVQNSAKDSAAKSDLQNAKTAVVAHYTTAGGEYVALDQLSADGYPGPSLDYGAGGSEPAYEGAIPAANSTTFCIEAQSPTGNWFHVNDSSGVEEGDCAGGGGATP